jgi:hypothetical protein
MSNRHSLTSPQLLPAVTYASFGLAVAPLLWALLSAIGDRQWSSAGAVGFLLVMVLGGLIRYTRRHIPVEPRKTTEFRPFQSLTNEQAWPRPLDTNLVTDDILKPTPHITLVIGSSGVGKSTLLDVLVRDHLTHLAPDLDYYIILDYSTLVSDFTRYTSDHTSGGATVIVLDQFEQWLSRIRNLPPKDRAEERESLRKMLAKALASKEISVVVSARREWYYDLRFLGDLIPSPNGACDIQGPLVDDDDDKTRQGIFDSFRRVLPDGAVAGDVITRIGNGGRLSPLEAQIVGAYVEQMRDLGKTITFDYFERDIGGANGAIESFFKGILAGAERPVTCLRVLCALSVKTRFRQQTELGSILSTLFETPANVRSTVAYLEKRGLLIKRTGGTYEVAHDFVAEYFTSKSGAELNPIERDNILCHAEAGGNTSLVVVSEEVAEQHRGFRFGRATAIALFALMTLRLLDLGIHWTLIGPNISAPIKMNLLDASYIPIFVPHAAWTIYISLFYDSVLARLNETRLSRSFSIFVVVNMAASVVVSVFIPFAWLLGIGTGGLVLALKLMSLASREDLNRTARNRLREFGSTTLFNLAFLVGLGAADLIVSLRLVHPHLHSHSDVNTWLALNIALSVVMTYAAVILASLHVSPSGVSQLLGLMARPLRISIARAGV